MNCLPTRGVCTDNKTCYCLSGFVNFETNSNNLGLEKVSNYQFQNQNIINESYCNYPQKKQLFAFILEFIFPFGVGHFYSLRTSYALIKMTVVIILPCLFMCLALCCLVKNNPEGGVLGFVGICLIAIVYSLWLLYDLINFGINNFLDGNGVPLQSWSE